jgi:hypothetical protein
MRARRSTRGFRARSIVVVAGSRNQHAHSMAMVATARKTSLRICIVFLSPCNRVSPRRGVKERTGRFRPTSPDKCVSTRLEEKFAAALLAFSRRFKVRTHSRMFFRNRDRDTQGQLMATRDIAITNPLSLLAKPIVSSVPRGRAFEGIAGRLRPANSWNFSFFAFQPLAILLEPRPRFPNACGLG